MLKIGFIGAGNMGGALAAATSRAETEKELYLSDACAEKAAALAASVGGTVADNETIARTCDMIFLAVKPGVLPGVLASLHDVLAAREKDSFTLVSMAAGVAIASIESALALSCPIIRIMPNTPVLCGEGMILYCANASVSATVLSDFRTVLSAAGELDALSESLIDAGCAVSGCGPAYVYLFIEALADGAVACGLPRDKAQKYAVQTLIGAATLVKTTGKHPGELKDAVCSPGGSTIAGVHALESGAFRADAMNAVLAAFKRTRELGKQ